MKISPSSRSSLCSELSPRGFRDAGNVCRYAGTSAAPFTFIL
jgi:hypothetical protein